MKRTKTKLVSSIVTLLVCFAMLVGSTFAWFTDSASTGVNKIQAGNLDLVVEHKNSNVTSYETIESKTNLFKDADGNHIKWEPGAMSWETFRVSNAGDLAFKYVLQTNIVGFNTIDMTKSLKDVLKVKVLTGDDILPNPTRESVTDLGWNGSEPTLDSFVKGDGKLYPNGTTGQISTEEFQVVVYWMPTANDNDWNVNNGKTTSDTQPLFVDFGIKVLATQLEHESDSFDNTYDKNATFSESVSSTVVAGQATTFTSAATPLNEAGATTSVKFPATVHELAVDSTPELTVVASPTVTANNKFTVSSGNGAVGAIDLTLTVNGTPVTNFTSDGSTPEYVTVTTYVAKGLTNPGLYYNGAVVSIDSYDSNTGKLEFKTNHFSTYVLSADETVYLKSNNTAYSSVDDAIDNISSEDTIYILKDTSITLNKLNDKTVTIDLNNHNLQNSEGVFNSLTLINNNTVVFKNGNLTVDAKDQNGTQGILCPQAGSSVELYNVKFTANNGAGLFPRGDAATVKVINSTITTNKAYCISTNANISENYNVNIIVENSTLSGWSPVLVNIPCTLNIKDSTITGEMHGVVVRGGTATISDSTITVQADADMGMQNYFVSRNWGSGNMVNLAALTFGNKYTTNAYQYPTNVTLNNSVIKAVKADGTEGSYPDYVYPAIYGYGNVGKGLGASLTYDENCTIVGEVLIGNEYASINGTSRPLQQ